MDHIEDNNLTPVETPVETPPVEPTNLETPPVEAADDLPTDKPVPASVKSFIDTISADAPASTEAPAGDKPTEEEPKPAEAKPDEPKTPEQEEAEVLEVVKSERGKERVQKVFSELKAKEAALVAKEAELDEIRTVIQGTGSNPDQLSQTLECLRLVNSGNPADLRVAAEMFEQWRAQIYQQLGVEAPGVDLLAGHDDLKSAVDNMEITRERALELAKLRKAEAERMQKTQAQQQSQQATQQFQQTVQTAAQQMEAYLSTRANEVDHQARMKVISDHFRNPANLQQFVNTYQPEQWTSTIKFMYDNIQVPKATAAPRDPQPLRSRPAALGTPSPAGSNPIDRIASHIDNMGL